ncbi:hypothetical protein JCM11491_000919 [Sporobolomyces phaffii]
MRTLFIASSILLSALLRVRAAPIEVAGDGLDESTWNATDKGIWLVEHYSPYCSHCRAFAPKWKELVEMYSLTGPAHDFHFAQVDCASNGDLCHQHNVKYYPSIFLYEDGNFKEEYAEKRSVEELARYVEGNWREAQAGVSDGPGETNGGSTLQTRPRPVKGAEKARLPKLHLQEEGEFDSGSSASSRIAEEAAKPYAVLLEDAQAQSKALVDPTLVNKNWDPTTTTQTPPSSPSSTTFGPVSQPPPSLPNFLAQQPESKRSAEAEGSSLTSQWEKSRGDPDGTVKLLSKADAERFKDQDAGPSFVKFYAPWCGHCKKLAPHWESLAASLTSQVHVYEVDCDEAQNKGICRQEGVQAYPTLIFYNHGAVVEYHGRREEKAMKEWSLKTIESTTIKPVFSEFELQQAIERDPVIVLFLYSNNNSNDDIALAREAAKSQMGSTPFLASTSPELFSRFSVPESSPPTFLVFKSSSLTPTSSFSLPPKPLTKRKRVEQTRNWLRGAKLPVVSELNGSTYPELFPEDADATLPYVTLGFFSRKGLQGEFDGTLKKFEESALEWSQTPQMHGQRSVVWAWVDGDRWAPWSRSSYDVKMGALDRPVVLISDPYNRVYWKDSLTGTPLRVGDPSVYDLIREGVWTGTVPGVSSDGVVGRWSKAFVKSTSGVFSAAMAHPFLTFFLVLLSWVGLAVLLQKLFASPISNASNGGNGYKSDGFVKKD